MEEMDQKKKCDCDCHDEYRDPNCKCGEECHCNDECKCGGECDCNDNCVCDECHCEEEKCDSDNKKLEKAKKEDKHGKQKYKNEIRRLEEVNKKLEQEVLVAKADLINYRKRKDEEVSRMLKFCNEDLVKELLPVIDNFERAIIMDDDNLNDEVSKFLSGIKMIYCSFINSVEKYGVKAIDGINKPFDPTFHQAVMTEKRDSIESGMVIEVLQKGYLLKDKVIRPAMVRVSE